MESNKVTISVDEENSAEEFWAAVRASDSCPDCIRSLAEVGGEYFVEVSAAEAAEAEEWCTKVPGYAAGPRHARTALVFN